MERVKWYRNASEKDKDNEHGKGQIVAISPMQNNGGGSAVIVDDEGNFVEKDLSLIKVDKEPPVDTTALQNELDKTVEANGKLSDDLNALQAEKKTVESHYHEKVDEIKALKDQIIELNKKVTPTTVPKSGKPVKK